MKTVVISQPMYFPWVGMLEQMALADVFVHLDDAQFSKGGFFNRVQIKTAGGTPWLTVPLAETKLGQSLNETRMAAHDWRRKQLVTLRQAYASAPHVEEMLALGQYDKRAALVAASRVDRSVTRSSTRTRTSQASKPRRTRNVSHCSLG